jgi:hypothetical protein
MNTSGSRISAKIYQFPLGGRSAPGLRAGDNKPTSHNASLRTVSIGGAWYHDAAIQDEKSRKV